jgi:glucose-1-phosphate adenylyltransferase
VSADGPALTPFAGRYRFVDFALATLANSGVATVYVLAPPPARALAAHLAATAGLRPARLRPHLLPLPTAGPGGRVARVGHALPACREVARKHRASTLIVMTADHVLRLDLRQALAAHLRLGADAVLVALPVPGGDVTRRTTLAVEADGRVRDLREPAPRPATDVYALAWAGDLVLRASALAADGPCTLQALIDERRVMAHDVLDGPAAGPCPPAPYWHDPTSIEDYYDAQMALCSARSPLDLHDPAWTMPAVATGLAPARVVADEVGRPGQTLNAIVSEGTVIRGGLVVNAVVSPRVLVESGAEVEDCVLLDGCRIGRNARVRRAVIGAGAVIEDGAEIGYGVSAAAAAFPVRPSGLTIVPAAAAERLVAAANAR